MAGKQSHPFTRLAELRKGCVIYLSSQVAYVLRHDNLFVGMLVSLDGVSCRKLGVYTVWA